MRCVDRVLSAVGRLASVASVMAALALLAPASNALAYQSIIVVPGSVSFGAVKVGERVYSSVTIENNGDEDVPFLSVLPIGDSSQLYVSNTCGYLNRYASCFIQIEFSPTRAGYFSSQISIYGGSASGSVTVYGEGVQ